MKYLFWACELDQRKSARMGHYVAAFISENLPEWTTMRREINRVQLFTTEFKKSGTEFHRVVNANAEWRNPFWIFLQIYEVLVLGL